MSDELGNFEKLLYHCRIKLQKGVPMRDKYKKWPPKSANTNAHLSGDINKDFTFHHYMSQKHLIPDNGNYAIMFE